MNIELQYISQMINPNRLVPEPIQPLSDYSKVTLLISCVSGESNGISPVCVPIGFHSPG